MRNFRQPTKKEGDYIYKEETRQNKRRYVIILLLLIILALIGAIIYIIYSHQQRIDRNQVGIVQGGENAVEYTQIPGFKTLTMTADTTEQEVYFQNPAENKVNLQLTLSLADGTQLYKSNLIQPGNAVKSIKISKKLESGSYDDAILHYDCYTADGQKCNSANLTFDLIVKEGNSQ